MITATRFTATEAAAREALAKALQETRRQYSEWHTHIQEQNWNHRLD